MSLFKRENFHVSNGYVEYDLGGERKFVARFKYQKAGVGTFITFLIKNFTTTEYFNRHQAGEGPLVILESKGYLLPHVKKILKQQGYPVTVEGKDQMISDQITNRLKKGV